MFITRQIVRQEARIAGRFRQAVPMADGKMKPIFEANRRFFQQWSRAADESLEAVEPVERKVFLRIEKEFEQGGNDAYAGDMLFVQSPPEGRAFEFPIQDQASLAIEGGEECNHNSVHMVDREHAHQAIVHAKVMPVGDRIGVGQQILHRQDHPLGRAGCSGCIDDEGFVLQQTGMRRVAGDERAVCRLAPRPLTLVLHEAVIVQRNHMP